MLYVVKCECCSVLFLGLAVDSDSFYVLPFLSDHNLLRTTCLFPSTGDKCLDYVLPTPDEVKKIRAVFPSLASNL